MPVTVQHDIAYDQNAGFFKLGQGDFHLYRLSKPEKSAGDFITLFYPVEKKPTAVAAAVTLTGRGPPL
ncbi:hypothetical protein [Aeromonas allosaccharophila]|uniref:hypothetical protein n=1 Tax=Aeromonas TaxID=642 RepID=UPI0018D9DD43